MLVYAQGKKQKQLLAHHGAQVHPSQGHGLLVVRPAAATVARSCPRPAGAANTALVGLCGEPFEGWLQVGGLAQLQRGQAAVGANFDAVVLVPALVLRRVVVLILVVPIVLSLCCSSISNILRYIIIHFYYIAICRCAI